MEYCEFCDEFDGTPCDSVEVMTKKINCGIFGSHPIGVWIENEEDVGNELTITFGENITDIISIPIKYCPACGKKLPEESE